MKRGNPHFVGFVHLSLLFISSVGARLTFRYFSLTATRNQPYSSSYALKSKVLFHLRGGEDKEFSTLPDGWIAVQTNENPPRTYYYHYHSRKTQWERPSIAEKESEKDLENDKVNAKSKIDSRSEPVVEEFSSNSYQNEHKSNNVEPIEIENEINNGSSTEESIFQDKHDISGVEKESDVKNIVGSNSWFFHLKSGYHSNINSNDPSPHVSHEENSISHRSPALDVSIDSATKYSIDDTIHSNHLETFTGSKQNSDSKDNSKSNPTEENQINFVYSKIESINMSEETAPSVAVGVSNDLTRDSYFLPPSVNRRAETESRETESTHRTENEKYSMMYNSERKEFPGINHSMNPEQYKDSNEHEVLKSARTYADFQGYSRIESEAAEPPYNRSNEAHQHYERMNRHLTHQNIPDSNVFGNSHSYETQNSHWSQPFQQSQYGNGPYSARNEFNQPQPFSQQTSAQGYESNHDNWNNFQSHDYQYVEQPSRSLVPSSAYVDTRYHSVRETGMGLIRGAWGKFLCGKEYGVAWFNNARERVTSGAAIASTGIATLTYNTGVRVWHGVEGVSQGMHSVIEQRKNSTPRYDQRYSEYQNERNQYNQQFSGYQSYDSMGHQDYYNQEQNHYEEAQSFGSHSNNNEADTNRSGQRRDEWSDRNAHADNLEQQWPDSNTNREFYGSPYPSPYGNR